MSDTIPVRTTIEKLIVGQRYGVLCVAGANEAYGALVAYAVEPDLSALYFATPITTRKFMFLTETDRAAFLIDNRSEHGDELMAVEAATLIGPARNLTDGDDLAHASRLLIARHVHLRSFVTAPSSAVFAISVQRVIHVSRFQEVKEWKPASAR